MASPSRALAQVAVGLTASALVLSGLWLLRGGPGERAAGPTVATSDERAPADLRAPGEEAREAAPDVAPNPAAGVEDDSVTGDEARVVVVVTTLDDQPVPGALVQITKGGPPDLHQTDAAGRCTLPVVAGPVSLVLRVDAEGFVPVCSRHGRQERIDVVLRRSIGVHGRVVSAEDHLPVPGARVTLSSFFGQEPAPEDVTDGTGRFRLDGLPLDQEVHWRVSAEGFATLQREMVLHDPSFEIELALVRGVPLDLRVIDAQTGAPIGGATISREGVELTQGVELTTDTRGRLETSALLAQGDAEARLQVRADSHCTLRALVRRAELTADGPLRLPLLAGVRLEGRVLAPDGAPVAGAWVSIGLDIASQRRAGEDPYAQREYGESVELPDGWSLRGAWTGEHASDEAGRFGFDGLEPSTRWYRVRVHDQDHARLAGWQQVPPLGPPGSTMRFDIVLPAPDTGVVTGTLSLNGVPVQGSLDWQGPTRSGYGATDATGSFHLEGVEPGRVTIRPQPEDLVGFPRCRELFAGPWIVDVTPDAEVRFDIPLELEMAPIAGRVVDAGGTPQADLQVMAFSSDGCWRDLASSGSDGSFELSVRTGPWGYRLTAGRFPDAARQEGVLAGARDLELVLPGSGKLRVRVVDLHTREPLSEFALFLDDERGRSHLLYGPIDSAFSADPAGWYETALSAGLWHLFVGDYSGGPVSGWLPVNAGEVRIEDCGPPVEVELEREKGAELVVRLAPDQEPWPASVSVLLLEADRCDQVGLGSNGWQIGQGFRGLNVVEARRLRPDAGGQARARALRRGACRLVAFPDTIAIEPAEIVVTGNETEPVEIRWMPR